jgi:hypothetical protein
MKKLFLLLALALGVAFSGQAQVKVYDESLDAMQQIQEATELAQKSGRYVLCQVGGNWCPWCLRFADFAKKDSVIAPLIEQNYVYIHVNYSKGNKNLKAMRFLGNPGRFGYPVFVILDSEGKPIHTQESESLEEGKGYSRQKVEKFLRLWTRQAVEAEAALLEEAYQKQDTTKLYEFFDHWAEDITSNENDTTNYKWLNERVAEAHKVFAAFYQPLQLEKIGFRSLQYQDYPYFIVQNNLFKISIADTLPFKPDELKAYYTNRIRQTYPDDSSRQKKLEFLQREIDIGRIHLVFDDDWFYEPWGQINTTEIESLRNSEFRPQVSFPNKKIVYLTDGYKKMLDDFLGDQHVDLGTESIMQVAYAKDESRQRMEFLMKAAKIFYGHWGGYWQYETYPKANQIIFDREMQRAVVFFRCVYEGGEVYLEKKDGEWTIVSGKLTWIE